jgi:hypothetical protein
MKWSGDMRELAAEDIEVTDPDAGIGVVADILVERERQPDSVPDVRLHLVEERPELLEVRARLPVCDLLRCLDLGAGPDMAQCGDVRFDVADSGELRGQFIVAHRRRVGSAGATSSQQP